MNSIYQFTEKLVEQNHQIIQSSLSVESAVERGRDSVKEVVGVMNQLEAESRNNEQGMNQLLLASQEIATISKLIKDIAEQTNLLALNANIEAARAGEHGKGFSIVANEVCKLASQSKQATIKIDKLISGLFEEINLTAYRTGTVLDLVNTGVDRISRSSTAFDRIEDELEKIKNQLQNSSYEGEKLSESTAASKICINSKMRLKIY
jgi:methyl-accepting chemotaxis protein